MQRIGYSNSLGRTLAHYQRELEDTLTRVGATPVAVRAGMAEGRSGLPGKLRTLGSAAANVGRIWATHADFTFILWPTLGLYELPLQPVDRAAVILHDPNPITDQFGYGSLVRKMLQHIPSRRLPLVVVHSDEGARDAALIVPQARIVTVAQPILSVPRIATQRPVTPMVLVAGQYKPTRNVELLNAIGSTLRERGIQPVAVGRGWATHLDSAWHVDDRFVSEEEMEREIERASLVLIPYSRYYQSNIALRAVELGTPVLGEQNSFMSMLYDNSDNLVPVGSGPTQYLEAIDRLIGDVDARPQDAYERYRGKVDSDWSSLLATVVGA